MIEKDILLDFLDLIPTGKVISYKRIAEIFCITIKDIEETVSKDSILQSKIATKGYFGLQKQRNIQQDKIWDPIITNYYISLVTKDYNAIKQFESISHKIKLLHPTCIIKTPTQYHITLADLSNIPINNTLIDNVFSETEGLSIFTFNCGLHKPYIDSKKNKVIFWIRLDNNPFLLTLQQCIRKYVPRRSDKQFIPHITLGKILGSTKYNEKMEEIILNTKCIFDCICVNANIDNHKDIILFSKNLQ